MTLKTVFQRRRWRLFLAPAMAAALFFFSPVSMASQDGAEEPPISQAELDQALAPIALYPDELLSQVLMAATYPLEIVEAARFVETNPTLDGAALTEALELRDWDPSVNSLVNFPDVLESLSKELKWTRIIGDAFLDDEGRVFDSVQELRRRAKAEGNLSSSEKLTVSTEAATSSSRVQTIIIESPSPQYVYVPVYDPFLVYGNWWWPGFTPFAFYQPRFYRPGLGLTFGLGFWRGAAWGFAWGSCDWRQRSISIDLNRNARFNSFINRGRYRSRLQIGAGRSLVSWRHDQRHRRGVSYRNRRTATKFGGRSRRDLTQSRRIYRGHLPSPRLGQRTRVPARSRTTTRTRTAPRSVPRTAPRTAPPATSRTRTRTRTTPRTTTRSRTQTTSRTRTSPFNRGRTTQPPSCTATRGRSSRAVQKRTTTTPSRRRRN